MIRKLLAAAMLILPSAASSEEALTEGWSGRATIYGWFTAIDAEAALTGPRGNRFKGSGSADVSDVFEALNFAFFANGELRRGRLGVVADIVYADLNFHQTNARGVRRDLDMNSFLGTGSLAWRVWEEAGGSVDLLGGARLVSTEVTLSRAGPLVSGSRSGSATWIDPIVGVRGRYPVAPRTAIFGLVDIGGFGIGSEFTWEAVAGVSYDFTERLGGELAFRYLSLDYDAGDVEQKLEMYGPVLGLSVRF